MRHFSRRHFLSNTLAAGASISGLSLAVSKLAAQPADAERGPRHD